MPFGTRRLGAAVALAATLALGACGGDDPVGPTSTLVVAAATSCGSGSIEITLDGRVQGTYPYVGGVTVKSFAVRPGTHRVSGREMSGSGGYWPEIEISVPSNSTFTLEMQC